MKQVMHLGLLTLWIAMSLVAAEGAEISGDPSQCGKLDISGTFVRQEGIPTLKVFTGTRSEISLTLRLANTPGASQAGLLLPAFIDQRVEVIGRLFSLIRNQRGMVEIETVQRANPGRSEGFIQVEKRSCE